MNISLNQHREITDTSIPIESKSNHMLTYITEIVGSNPFKVIILFTVQLS